MRDYLKSSISLSPHQSVEVIYNSSIGYSQEAKLDMPDLKLIVFIGRLSEEKGIHNLLRGWDICNLDKSKWKLVIAGSGPNEDLFEKERPGVEFRGMLNTSEVSELLNYSRIVVVPSLWFEGFPLVVSEAAAKGKPVIVSKIGSLGSLELGDWIIKTGVTPEAIAETLNGLDGVDLLRIGRLAREWHKNQGYQELQIRKLVDVYKSAIKNSH
jgi:glycosyltransferase involved in cell wall biosynthesis